MSSVSLRAMELAEEVRDASVTADRVRYAAAVQAIKNEMSRLREVVEEYADHQSWRCGHPDRYPWEPDCPCGLVSALKELGIQARNPVAG